MTEAEWLACDDPQWRLEFIHDRMTARKRRLLAAAFARRFLALTDQPCVTRAVEIAEAYADGLVSIEAMRAVSEQVAEAYLNYPNPAPINTAPPLEFNAASITIQTAQFLTLDYDRHLIDCCITTETATTRWTMLQAKPGDRLPPYSELMAWQTALIDDVLGNPFRTLALAPSLLTPTVVNLAQVAYEARSLPSGELDTARLAVLSDALEDAGCTDAALLSHLREPGPHVRGCWALDLVLAKE